MAKFKTLDMHLVNLNVTRLGPGNYVSNITARDWDDGEEATFSLRMAFPVIALSILKIRIQIEDLQESPPPAT